VLSALTLSYVGRGEDAVRHAEQALRLSPVDQLLFYYYNALSWAHFSLARHEEAAKWARLSASENPKFTANLRILIASLSALGKQAEARGAAECLLRQNPDFRLSRYEKTLQPFRDDAIRRRFMQYLGNAGLPE
jgi:adenylate cyclase